MLVWSQATYGDEALAKSGTRTRLVNARRFGEFIQRVSGETVDPAEEPARFGLAILVMIDRYWSYWRVNDFPLHVCAPPLDLLGFYCNYDAQRAPGGKAHRHQVEG